MVETPQAHKIGLVSTSVTHGKYTFPTRSDYEQYYVSRGVIAEPDDLWKSDDLLPNIQRNWHSRGQNGCVFARSIASKADLLGWDSKVVNSSMEELADAVSITKIDAAIQTAIESPDNQILSLLFPQVTQPEQLADLMSTLEEVPSIITAGEKRYEALTTVAYRASVNDANTLSWLMGLVHLIFFQIHVRHL